MLDQTENTLKAYADGKQGILRLGVECHPCYEWLKGILAEYLQILPRMDVDIVHKFQFSGLEGLLNFHIDLLVTPGKVNQTGLNYAPLFDYELVLLVDKQHQLAEKRQVEADLLSGELLLTFPVAHERLDKKGVRKTLFAAMRDGEQDTPYMQQFVELGQTAARY